MKEKQILALEYLSVFKVLTSSQFVQLHLYKHRGDVTNTLKILLDSKRALIGKKNFQPDPSFGRVESMYYLTRYGRDYLIKKLNYEKDAVKFINNNNDLFQKDYYHRKFTVDFQIGLQEWLTSLDGEIIFCHRYFDKIGNNRKRKVDKHVYSLSRLKLKSGESFIPDAISMFSAGDREYLFLFEQHNGKSTKRLIRQLETYRFALTEDIFEVQYGFEKSPRIAIVCENESVKINTIKRLQEDKRFDNFHNFFIFKSNRELEQNFNQNWSLINGQKVSFLEPKR